MLVTKADINQMSWSEFEELIDALISKVSSYFSSRKEEINVIAPLLRTGGIVGGVLSIKMRVVTMLPVQFKYFYHPTTVNQILSIPEILSGVPESMNVLLCEGNTSSGSIAVKAAAAIKAKYPHAKLYLATLTKVYGGSERLEGIEEIFYGRLTNENFKASEEEQQTLDLRKGVTIFPWENVDDEISDINAI
jgi:hypothetical protein